MNPHAIESIGYIGAIILNTSALPQIYKTYQTKTAKDLSWGFFGTLGVGFMFNITYGALIGHPAIYCGSSVSMLLYGTLAGMKYIYEKPTRDVLTEKDDAPLCVLPLSTPSDLRTKI